MQISVETILSNLVGIEEAGRAYSGTPAEIHCFTVKSIIPRYLLSILPAFESFRLDGENAKFAVPLFSPANSRRNRSQGEEDAVPVTNSLWPERKPIGVELEPT